MGRNIETDEMSKVTASVQCCVSVLSGQAGWLLIPLLVTFQYATTNRATVVDYSVNIIIIVYQSF